MAGVRAGGGPRGGRRLTAGRPPRCRGTRTQERALERFFRTLVVQGTPGVVSGEVTRAVLAAIAGHVDGAGYAWLLVETVVVESGVRRRGVFRALKALERDGLIERIPTKRTKGNRGQGATTYRLGASIRAAVGLHETEWAPDVGRPVPMREDEPIAPPGGSALVAEGPASPPDAVRHPGDALVADLLRTFSSAAEVESEEEGWTGVVAGRYGTLAVRDAPARVTLRLSSPRVDIPATSEMAA